MSKSISKMETLLLKALPSSITFPSSLLEADQSPVITDPATETAIKQAAALLRKGELVAFPTETVYGLGANALDGNAVKKIYQAKGRPSDNPLIVHVSSLAMLHSLLPASRVPLSKTYSHLTNTHWPGALTLLFPSSSLLPSITTASLSTVAIRMPSHPVARALIHYAGVPLAAPSANSSGRPSPTRADHVFKDLEGKVGLILDGGNCEIGLESTVLDCGEGTEESYQGADWRVLRPGGVTVESLETSVDALFGESEQSSTDCSRPKVLVWKKDFHDPDQEAAPRTPGMKYKHYTPGVPVYILTPCAQSLEQKGKLPSPEEAILSLLDLKQESTSLCSPSQTSPSLSPAPVPASSASSASPSSSSVSPSTSPLRPKIGLMHYAPSPLSSLLTNPAHPLPFEIQSYPLGPRSQPDIAAQRLFAGLLELEAVGCEAIFVEEGLEEGVGRAVGERLGKAVGGKAGVIVKV